MFDTKQFISSIKQIAEEKGVPEIKVKETIELAVAAAYKRDYGEKSQIIRAKIDPDKGEVDLTRIKIVVEGVDEEGYVTGEVPDQGYHTERGGRNTEEETEDEMKIKFNPEKHITLEEAKEEKKSAEVGDEIITKLESKTDFGRIAAQTAKQVIIQRLREIEREAVLEEYKDKEGEVMSGIVQRVEGQTLYIDLGRTNGVLIPSEQAPNERFRIGHRAKFYIVRVEDTNKGPVVILSRSHPKLILRLFEFEVPEIEADSVEIKAIAREAGSRSKVAVASHEEGIDPIGSLVGQKGVRVQTVINELAGEKIDIIEWDEDPSVFIAHALSPAKIMNVKVLDEEEKHALVEVAEDQFSLAIGKQGQNVRLAAKLVGWKIDVRAPDGEKVESDEEQEVTKEETNTEDSDKD